MHLHAVAKSLPLLPVQDLVSSKCTCMLWPRVHHCYQCKIHPAETTPACCGQESTIATCTRFSQQRVHLHAVAKNPPLLPVQDLASSECTCMLWPRVYHCYLYKILVSSECTCMLWPRVHHCYQYKIQPAGTALARCS